jgi:parallel beta-helix repeat protein
MSRTIVRTITVALVVAAGLLGQSLSATTVVVGPSTCKPSYVHFADIQSAVNASPFSTTILVCPGIYAQQVVINEPLTLMGVTDGTGNAAVITVPGAGMVQNGTSVSFGPVAVQLLVENTVGVTLKNLVVDGNGANCPAGSNRQVGIGAFNNGTPVDGTSAVKIQNVVVRNEMNCFGDGVLADTSFATITGSEIHDVNQTAIDAYSGKYSITNNSIQRSGAYGIVLLNTATGTLVSGNNVSEGSFTGILSEAINAATITKNTVLNNVWVGLYLFFASNQTVTQNVASNSFWPVYVWFSSSNIVQGNTLSDGSFDNIVDVDSFGGNNITRNTVNEGFFGIFVDGTTGGDTLVPNTFYNVTITIDPGPPSQQPAQPGSTP